MLLHKSPGVVCKPAPARTQRCKRVRTTLTLTAHTDNTLCSNTEGGAGDAAPSTSQPRRALLLMSGAAAAAVCSPAAQAVQLPLNPLDKDYKMAMAQRRRRIPVEEFSDGPQGLKYYDIQVGEGDEPVDGDRVAVHIDVKYRNITFTTSRAGLGVTGGTPVGFNVGTPPGQPGGIGLPGIDLGVRGMRVGGFRRLLVPPQLGYGDMQVGEIAPNSTLLVDVELLSIKPKTPFGTPVKLVEG